MKDFKNLLRLRQSWNKIPGFYLGRQCQLLRDVILEMKFPLDHVIVEIGSWLGRSTICMAEVSKHKIVSIDPHNGYIQRVLDGKMEYVTRAKTYKPFLENLKRTNTTHKVEVIKDFPERVEWDGRPIAFLHLDGIHDREHLEIDMRFAEYIPAGGFIAFHDYGISPFPDVKEFVDKKILGNGYRDYKGVHCLKVVQKMEVK